MSLRSLISSISSSLSKQEIAKVIDAPDKKIAENLADRDPVVKQGVKDKTIKQFIDQEETRILTLQDELQRIINHTGGKTSVRR